MNTELDVKFVARNVWQDTMRDGLMELFMGLYLLLTGIVILADMTALFILLMVFISPVVRKMKERYTHPRIGYVKSSEAEKNMGKKILAALVGGVIAVALVVLLSKENDKTRALYQWVPLLPALILAVALFIIGGRTGFLRYHIMAIFSLAAGVAVPLLGLTERMDSIATYLLITGPVLLIWGAVIFLTFLRTYPVREQEAG